MSPSIPLLPASSGPGRGVPAKRRPPRTCPQGPMATTPNRTDLLPEEPADSERRTSTRYGFGAAALIRLYLPGRDEQMYGYLHDLSATGIAFDLLGAVECGEMVVAKLRTAETTRVE